MRLIEALKRRYARWLYARLAARLVADGYWDAQPGVLAFMLEEIQDRQDYRLREPSIDERLTIEYVSRHRSLDDLLVQVMEATRALHDRAYVEPPSMASTPLIQRMDHYLTDNYDRPLPVGLALPQSVKIISQFLAEWHKLSELRHQSYYARRYAQLMEEIHHWLEFALEHLL